MIQFFVKNDILIKKDADAMNKILIVEDEEAISNLIQMSLKNAGYFCDVANTGLDGADKMQANHYDLCLLDIMLPGFDGYELLDFAKSIELPVIFLTAKGETEDKVKGLRAGADDYITKPFEVLDAAQRFDIVVLLLLVNLPDGSSFFSFRFNQAALIAAILVNNFI